VYATARWVAAQGLRFGLDGSRLAVAGDCVGGNLAIALTLLARYRADFAVLALAALCPVTDASCDTESYRMFGEGYALGRDTMRWCWDQYIADPGRRGHITVSPLRATLTELAGFPPSLIITAEADVVRDEGEAFAANLRAAGVPTVAVRYDGVIHNFAVLNALKDTLAAKAATAQTASLLSNALVARS
jgi:acetyl esterase/lipase